MTSRMWWLALVPVIVVAIVVAPTPGNLSITGIAAAVLLCLAGLVTMFRRDLVARRAFATGRGDR